MGATCEIVNQSFDGLIPALNAKKIDAIIASMTITEDRLKAIDFAGPYYTVPALFIAPKDAGVEISEDGLDGKYCRRPARHDDGELRQGEVPGGADPALRHLRTPRTSTSRAGASTWSSPTRCVLQDFLATPDGADFAMAGEPVDDPAILGTGAGIGVRKGDDALKQKFNDALKAAIIASGEYKTINDTYIPVSILPPK